MSGINNFGRRDSLAVYIERAIALVVTGLLIWVGASVSELKTDVAQVQVHVDYLRDAVSGIQRTLRD